MNDADKEKYNKLKADLELLRDECSELLLSALCDISAFQDSVVEKMADVSYGKKSAEQLAIGLPKDMRSLEWAHGKVDKAVGKIDALADKIRC